ncbi:MAG: putative sulfate exporter family transporter [Peptococcaceae bacterium]|nr:putative sulfate exporter family transporter [Peptococcaceae bacterium]
MSNLWQLVPGIFFVFVLALVANWLGNKYALIGGAVFGIIIGILINNTVGKPSLTVKGVAFTGKKILQLAIIVLGAGLSLTQVWHTGLSSLYVMVFTLSTAFLAAFGFGKLMRIPLKLTTLIGVGTAICGGSAIAAVSPIVEAEDMEIAYAISTIFLFNVIAVLIFPPLGHLMGFSSKAFGLWAGTAINDTSSVVAAGYAYSNTAGAYATIVKLTRTTMIIPVSLVLTAIMARHNKIKFQAEEAAVNFSIVKIFPWFILWFLVASLMNTLGLFSKAMLPDINTVGKFLIIMALTAIGLGSNFKQLAKTGIKPLLLGLIVWFVVAAVSIAVQFSMGQI